LGDNYNQGGSGTAKLAITKVSTKTTITCSTSTIAPGKTMVCTATVTGTYSSHTGRITWSKSAGTGKVTFSSATCKLASGKCSVTVKGIAKGSVTLKAAYNGDTCNLISSGTLVRTIS
jgi:hypothetical protein